jgi:hypothetical protein
VTISPTRGNAAWRLGLAVALALIGVATLIPQGGGTRTDVAVLCLRCGAMGGPDLVLNVVLFVPLGVALAWWGARPGRALAIGLALSVAIEIAQLGLPGRFATLRDAACNAAGAWLGAVLALHLARWLAPSRAAR